MDGTNEALKAKAVLHQRISAAFYVCVEAMQAVNADLFEIEPHDWARALNANKLQSKKARAALFELIGAETET